METLAPVPANADNTAQVDAPEADAEGTEANGDGSAPSVPEADTPEQKKSAVQERIDKLTREKHDNARLADQRGYELDRERSDRKRLEAEIAELRKAQTSQVAPGKRPTLEQFGYDVDKFNEALDAYHEAKSASAKEAARQAALEALQAERDAEAAERSNKSWATKEAEFLKSKPDYTEKVVDAGRRGAWACTREMGAVIKQSEIGPAIAYYLAEHTDIAAEIAKKDPLVQAREIGRIEAKLELAKAPPKPAVSQAPPPVNKVDSADAQAEKTPAEMTDNEFAKWRKKQIAARRNQ
jgi:hypothetical protein